MALYRDSGGSGRDNDEDKEFYYDDDDNEEDDDDDDDEPPEVDISQFSYTNSNLDSSSSSSISSFGYNKGRSSPNQRKAMGKSFSSVTRIHICTNYGSEFVKWMGRCPTCKQWNTLQEHAVFRDTTTTTTTTTTDPFGNIVSGAAGLGRPVFAGGSTGGSTGGIPSSSILVSR